MNYYTGKDELDSLINLDHKILFVSKWLGILKNINSLLISSNLDDILYIDIDDYPNIANELEISLLPTLAIYSDGVLRERYSGFIPFHKILS
jgi:hypothetical protein